MNRAKAMVVLHKISDKCKMVTMDIISLDEIYPKDDKTSENYQIKMKCSCDVHTCKELTSILEEHHLEMKEDRDFLILTSKT